MGQEFRIQDIFSIYIKGKKIFIFSFILFFSMTFFALYLTKKPIWQVRSSYVFDEVDSVENAVTYLRYNFLGQHSEQNTNKMKDALEPYLNNEDLLTFLSKNIKITFAKNKESSSIVIGFYVKNEHKDVAEKLLDVFEKYILHPKVKIIYRNQILKKRTMKLIKERISILELIKKNREDVKLATSEIKFFKNKKHGVLTGKLVAENILRLEVQIHQRNESNKLLKIKENELIVQIKGIDSLRKMMQIPTDSINSVISIELQRVQLFSDERIQQIFKRITEINANYGLLKKIIVASLLSFLLASICVFFTHKRE